MFALAWIAACAAIVALRTIATLSGPDCARDDDWWSE